MDELIRKIIELKKTATPAQLLWHFIKETCQKKIKLEVTEIIDKYQKANIKKVQK